MPNKAEKVNKQNKEEKDTKKSINLKSNINKLQGHAFSLTPVNVVLQCALVCVLKLSSCHISCIIKLTLESIYRGGLPNRL